MPRPKQRTPELRDHVLTAAVELLVSDGVATFTARNIARTAGTSTPAVYELFGDKSGLVRAVFFEGFRLLRRYLDTLDGTDDPLADLMDLVAAYRTFVRENPVLTQVMFSRPFSDFDPTEAEREAGAGVRTIVVDHVRRCVDADQLCGDPIDIAHVVVALTQGLALAEAAGRLGTTETSVDRRCDLAIRALITGFGPPAA
ncbi:TetR/AcrR family transcriptional regulator [Streptomyces shenzhenensis]|uniref:TetR/AcrR family transcriptional regulator n=1 Tax=Streptomyces shenzhenensis TaxID=943815 RepID=UPI0033CB4C7D